MRILLYNLIKTGPKGPEGKQGPAGPAGYPGMKQLTSLLFKFIGMKLTKLFSYFRKRRSSRFERLKPYLFETASIKTCLFAVGYPGPKGDRKFNFFTLLKVLLALDFLF